MEERKIVSGTHRISIFQADSERQDRLEAAAPARCTCSGAQRHLGIRFASSSATTTTLCQSESSVLHLREVYKPESTLQTYVQFRGGRAGGPQLDGSVTQQPVHRVHSRCCPSRHTRAPPRRELVEARRRTLALSRALSLSLRRKARVVLLCSTHCSALGCVQGLLGNPRADTAARKCTLVCPFCDDDIVTHQSLLCFIF